MTAHPSTHDDLARDRLPFAPDLEVVLPGDPGWDAARQAWNAAADLRPGAVVFPRHAAHVQQVVNFARERGYRVEAQSTGHGAAATPALDRAILVRTSKMRAVTVDRELRIARAEAGAQWQDVTAAAAPHGMVALAGSAADVGVAGYTLRGGISWLGREHGLAANHVTAISVVTSDGALRRVSARSDEDLFWALRGGGGLGVVTAIEFRLFPVTTVFAGMLAWPWERAGEVLKAWRTWTAAAPETATSVGRILQFPPFEQIPAPLRGRSFAIVEVAFHGDEPAARELLGPLTALGPEIDTLSTMPASRLHEIHMDPPAPTPFISDQQLLSGLPDSAIDALVAAAGAGSGSPLISVELRHTGGALARAPRDGGAYSAVPGQFLAFSVGLAVPGAAEAGRRYFAAVRDALAPVTLGPVYPSFVDEPRPASAFHDEATVARLREIKSRHDPRDMFVGGAAPAAATEQSTQ